MRINGDIPLQLLYAFMVWKGKTLLFVGEKKLNQEE